MNFQKVEDTFWLSWRAWDDVIAESDKRKLKKSLPPVDNRKKVENDYKEAFAKLTLEEREALLRLQRFIYFLRFFPGRDDHSVESEWVQQHFPSFWEDFGPQADAEDLNEEE